MCQTIECTEFGSPYGLLPTVCRTRRYAVQARGHVMPPLPQILHVKVARLQVGLSCIHPSIHPFIVPNTYRHVHSSAHSPTFAVIRPHSHPSLHAVAPPHTHHHTNPPAHSLIFTVIHPRTQPFLHTYSLKYIHSHVQSPSQPSTRARQCLQGGWRPRL